MKIVRVTLYVVGALILAGVCGLFVLDRMADVPIRFYGRVVDTAGQPVVGAQVSVRVIRRGGGRLVVPALFATGGGSSEVLLPRTDASGLFAVTTRGSSLRIDDILADGFRPQNWPVATFYFGHDAPGVVPLVTSPQQPHVLTVRRRKGT